MLLREKMQIYPFSDSEKKVITILLEKGEQIASCSVQNIAKSTYTSPSILVRLAKKLGFSGWKDFKEAFLEETRYLNSHFQNIDANIPFSSKDSMMTIAGKITALHQESIADTMHLLSHTDLHEAVYLMNKSREIRIFCLSDMNYPAESFAFKLRRINKRAFIDPVQDNMFHDAIMTTEKDCAICISYSGESPTLLKFVRYLRENHVPIIAITSIGDNSLSKVANVTLRLCTREKSFSKIYGFSSMESVNLILDILYAELFAMHYEQNLKYKLDVADRVERDRVIDNQIIKEDI